MERHIKITPRSFQMSLTIALILKTQNNKAMNQTKAFFEKISQKLARKNKIKLFIRHLKGPNFLVVSKSKCMLSYFLLRIFVSKNGRNI